MVALVMMSSLTLSRGFLVRLGERQASDGEEEMAEYEGDSCDEEDE